jgi:hypothetical protein
MNAAGFTLQSWARLVWAGMVQQGHDLHLEQSNTLVPDFNGFAVMIG